MSMVTSCPRCHTTFRIKDEELGATRGQVRCGQCSAIFSAFDTLATLDDPLEETGRSNPPIEGGATAEAPRSQTKVSSTSEPSAKPLSFIDMAGEKAARKNGRTWLWFIAALMMLILLAAQVTYNFRAQIAAYYPELKPYLQRSCEFLQCTVGLPKFSDLLTIESSDLQADPGRPNLIVLTALLRNRALFGQAYPALEITFTDTQDQMVARRAFTAAEYLGGKAVPKDGMPANSEFGIKLYIDSDDLKPAGYRLLLFYP